jgi:hypothetical protein
MKHPANSLIFALVFSIMAHVANGQGYDILSNFERLPQQKLLDTATYYYNKSSFDTALVLFSSIINAPVKDTDIEQQKRVIEAQHPIVSHKIPNQSGWRGNRRLFCRRKGSNDC